MIIPREYPPAAMCRHSFMRTKLSDATCGTTRDILIPAWLCVHMCWAALMFNALSWWIWYAASWEQRHLLHLPGPSWSSYWLAGKIYAGREHKDRWMSLGKAVLVCDLMRIASLRNVLHRGENYFNTSECGNFELFMLPEHVSGAVASD